MAVVEDLRDMFRVAQLQRMRKARDKGCAPLVPPDALPDPPGLRPMSARYGLPTLPGCV